MRGLLSLLFLAEFARGAFFFTFLPVWVTNHLKLPVTVVGFAVSAHFLTETLCKIIAGWEFDRLGRRVLIGGLILSFVSFFLIKNWPVPLVIIGASGLFGIGFSPLWLGVISKVAPVQIPNRAWRISLVFVAWLAGAGGGMIGCNFFMFAGYETVFLLIIVLWAFLLPVAWFSTIKISSPAEKTSLLKAYRIQEALKYMRSSRTLIKLLLPGMFIQTLAVGFLLPILPVFAQQNLHLDHTRYGLLLSSGGAALLISLPPMGYLADRLALKFLLAAGFSASSLLLVLITFSNGIGQALILAILLGLSYAMILPAWNNLLARAIPPESQATGWGVFATIEGAGIAFGPAFGALIAGRIGAPSAILLTSLVLLAAALFYVFYPN